MNGDRKTVSGELVTVDPKELERLRQLETRWRQWKEAKDNREAAVKAGTVKFGLDRYNAALDAELPAWLALAGWQP